MNTHTNTQKNGIVPDTNLHSAINPWMGQIPFSHFAPLLPIRA